MTTVKNKRESNLLGSLSRNEQKKDKKGAARATAPGMKRERVRERNAAKEYKGVKWQPVAHVPA